jgi:hypothetical protein
MLSSYVGAEKAKKLVNKALVLITIGGNDFVNNYYLLPYSVRSREFSLPDYVKYLIFEYKKILTVCRYPLILFLDLKFSILQLLKKN